MPIEAETTAEEENYKHELDNEPRGKLLLHSEPCPLGFTKLGVSLSGRRLTSSPPRQPEELYPPAGPGLPIYSLMLSAFPREESS